MKESFKQYFNDILNDTNIEDAFHDEEIFEYIRINYGLESIFDLLDSSNIENIKDMITKFIIKNFKSNDILDIIEKLRGWADK